MDAVERQDEADQPTDPSAESETPAPTLSVGAHDPYAALRYRDFRLLTVGRLISSLGEQMLTVAISWELYQRVRQSGTESEATLALGLVGLTQIVPVIALALPAGHIADRYNRKRILLLTQFLLAVCSLGLALWSGLHGSLIVAYGCLFLIGVARAFNGPTSS